MAEQSNTDTKARMSILALELLVWVGTFFLAFSLRRPLADDAYITFRYAQNFIDGFGLVYNPGENVLGLSTPLWGALLSLCGMAGLPFEGTALFFGALSLAASLLLVQKRIYADLLPRYSRVFLVPLVVLHVYVSVTVFSGMETCLYTFLVLLALFAVLDERHYRAAFYAALGTLIRPDGVLLIVIVAVHAVMRSKGRAVRSILLYAFIIAPWVAYAAWKYGSPVPHSVAAKRVLHPSPLWNNTLVVSEVFSTYAVDLFLVTVFGAGLLLLLGQKKFWPFTLWPLLYAAGIAASGIKPIFYWYFAPLWFFLLALGPAGLLLHFREMELQGKSVSQHWKQIVQFALPMVAVIAGISGVARIRVRDVAVERDNVYRAIGSKYRSEIGAGETIYVCETGVLGFYFLRSKIFDASGINSPEAYRYRSRAREELSQMGKPRGHMGVTSWSIDLVKEYEPDWIVSPRDWCQLGKMEAQSWFQERYVRVELRFPEHLQGIGVYRKK